MRNKTKTSDLSVDDAILCSIIFFSEKDPIYNGSLIESSMCN